MCSALLKICSTSTQSFRRAAGNLASVNISAVCCPVGGAGRFQDELEAAQAYDKAAIYLYGNKAITNFGLDVGTVDGAEVRQNVTMALTYFCLLVCHGIEHVMSCHVKCLHQVTCNNPCVC